MLAALTLADAGNDVAIVDSAPRACTSSNSAILHPSTLKVLERMGMVERLIEAGYRIEKIDIYDGISHRDTLNLSELPIAFPYALSIPQSELELFLEDELEQAGIRVLWNHRVSEYQEEEGELNVTVDRYSERDTGYAVSHTERVIVKSLHFKAKTMIAADGYNSILRRIAGVEPTPLGDNQYFVSFEFETDRDPKHTYLLSFKDDLATAQHPMEGGIARLQFQFSGLTLPSSNREKDRSFLQDKSSLPDYLDEKHFNELLKSRVPWRTGYINRLRYRAAIPFVKRYLKKPRSGNVLFLGDSARSFGPLGSLSLNLGIQEAEQLAKTILETADEPQYRDERFDQICQKMVDTWKQLANLDEFAVPGEMAEPWISKNRGKILRALPATGDTLERLANQAFIHINTQEFSQI